MNVCKIIQYSPRVISFGANKKKEDLPVIKYPTEKSLNPVGLPGVSYNLASGIINSANKMQVSVDTYLREYLKHLYWQPRVQSEESITRKVGKTNVTTLIDGEQIFDKSLKFIQDAKKSVQVEMFEFQNMKIDGDVWPSKGAEVVPGFEKQQKIVDTLIKKKKQNPDMKIQVILDAHKWYTDGNGYRRHYGNMKMIKYLKENGIDVVPYPRAAQQGASLQHVKLLITDNRNVVIGGMNWGTHSCANHDACVAIQTLPGEKNSEVDNITDEIFNKDWKFAWQRLGATKFVAGPLTPGEQKEYGTIKKEIKRENVEYMEIVGRLYDNPSDRNRYDENRLDLVECNPISDPKIKVLATKPRELAYVDEMGKETTRDYLKERLMSAKKLRAELFVISDKEIVETICKRHRDGNLDAKFIVSSDILESFPYCRRAYDTLLSSGVPVRLYNFDERINQRLHSKWAVFDDTELLIGSTNWSTAGLNSNLRKGQRDDYELYVEKINLQIKKLLKDVRPYEKALGIKPISDNKKLDYDKIQIRTKKLKRCYRELREKGSAEYKVNDKKYILDERQKSAVSTIIGYYELIKERNNSKEKYKRGNNECAIVIDEKDIAKVFINQFNKDWLHSKDSELEIKNSNSYATIDEVI